MLIRLRHRSNVLSLAACAALALIPCAIAAAGGPAVPQYQSILLEGIPAAGFSNVFPADINNRNQVVGRMDLFPGFVPVRAFLWQDGTTIDIGDLGVFAFVEATAINEAGRIVGRAERISPVDGLTRKCGFVWEGGRMTPLEPLPGHLESAAFDINEHGKILGRSGDGDSMLNDHIVIWTTSGAIVADLGPVLVSGGALGTLALSLVSMNDNDQFTGTATTESGMERAVLWDSRAVIDLGLAPGDDFASQAFKINNAGRIVGQSQRLPPPGGRSLLGQGVLWQAGAKPVITDTFDPLPGDTFMFPLGLNERGDAVGMSGFPQEAVLFKDGVLYDLNTLLAPGDNAQGLLWQGRDINDNGWIVVDGFISCCGYVLVPVIDKNPADLNGDGVVNTLDLGILLSSWSIPPGTPACGGSLPCPADINHDGFVNTLDLGILLSNWTL